MITTFGNQRIGEEFANVNIFFSFAVPPTVKSPNNVIGAPIDSNVTMQCLVEVFPKPLNGWFRNDGELFL